MRQQLDFFQEFTEYDYIREEIAEVTKSHHKLRKSVWAQLNELSTLFLKQQEEIDRLRTMLIKEHK